MKIGRRRREDAEVESSAMNDIMFFLMLFFLIVSTLANPNVVPITLPSAKTTEAIVPKSVPLTVRRDPKIVEAERQCIAKYGGEFNLNGDTKLEVYIEKDPLDYVDLENRLKELKSKYNNPESKDGGLVVVLRADSKAYVQDLVDVMQVGANLGIKMVLATEKNKK